MLSVTHLWKCRFYLRGGLTRAVLIHLLENSMGDMGSLVKGMSLLHLSLPFTLSHSGYQLYFFVARTWMYRDISRTRDARSATQWLMSNLE